MTFEPRRHAQWGNEGPLRAGLAVERVLKGTLGAAIALRNFKTYFMCARHVAGPPNASPEALSVYRRDVGFQTEPGLERLTENDEPGDEETKRELDLALLETPGSAVNVTPDNQPPVKSLGVVSAGDRVLIRGCLHEDWIETTYKSDYSAEEHDPFFRGLDLWRLHLGIIDLGPLGAAQDQPGNSGAAIWTPTAHGYALIGHLVGVSFDGPLGLIVLYRYAFGQLGFPLDCVVNKV